MIRAGAGLRPCASRFPFLMKPVFFASPAQFRAWLVEHHADATELWVGFYRKDSGQPSITWPESVDEALCFGWIDGLRKRVDARSYMIRFTPRRSSSIWSAINMARVRDLTRQKRMRPAGLAAFRRRVEAKSGIYAYEQRKAVSLDAGSIRRFRARPEAWDFFHAQSPSYRQVVVWWIVSAKREETRKKRMEKLIEHSARRLKL